MIKFPLIAAFFLLATAGFCNSQSTIIQPEVPTVVNLSNKDINRIVCPGKMDDLIFSQEKGLTGHFSGNNGFIKFKIEKIGNELVYADTQSELFVVCNNAVYALLVTPADISSVTLHLASPAKKSFKENIAHYKNLPLEKQALQLIREAYKGSYPTSYRVIESQDVVPLTSKLQVQLLQTIDVEGVGLRLKKYQATSLTGKQVRIDEKNFLNASFGTSILAIGVENHVLDPNQSTRVFVVEQKEQQQ